MTKTAAMVREGRDVLCELVPAVVVHRVHALLEVDAVVFDDVLVYKAPDGGSLDRVGRGDAETQCER